MERCHRETIYRALKAGSLEGYRLRGKRSEWRITAEALDRYRRGGER